MTIATLTAEALAAELLGKDPTTHVLVVGSGFTQGQLFALCGPLGLRLAKRAALGPGGWAVETTAAWKAARDAGVAGPV